jgi:hypothetical protein
MYRIANHGRLHLAGAGDRRTRLRVDRSIISYEGSLKDQTSLSRALRDRYRCPDRFLEFTLIPESITDDGLFEFASDAISYNNLVSADERLMRHPDELIDSLRLERYLDSSGKSYKSVLKGLYYLLRPLTTPSLRRRIQKFHTRGWRNIKFPHWPVDTTVEDIHETLLLLSLRSRSINSIPFIWFWPHGARGCVTMTHDVETVKGRDFCRELMDVDDSFGIKASFQVIPQSRYAVSESFLDEIRKRGFEIGVQDLNHDGRLFDDREEFRRRAAIINRYGKEYGAKGFRAGVLYRRPEWYENLEFAFDMSIPNVAHLDPQQGGCCTVMPYFIGDILELPLTTSQDYTLFHLLNERSIDLWNTQVEMILRKNGLASFIVHPDYVTERDTRSLYEALLGWLNDLRNEHVIWSALPSEIDSWWRARNKMSVVEDGDCWRIEGDGAERAVLAFAKEADGHLVYEIVDSLHVGYRQPQPQKPIPR